MRSDRDRVGALSDMTGSYADAVDGPKPEAAGTSLALGAGSSGCTTGQPGLRGWVRVAILVRVRRHDPGTSSFRPNTRTKFPPPSLMSGFGVRHRAVVTPDWAVAPEARESSA